MTIRKKLITIQIFTAFVVLVLASAVFVQNEIQLFRTELVKNLSSMAMLIGENSASTLVFMDNQSAERVLASLQVEPHIANACIYDAQGGIFATYSRKGDEQSAFPQVSEAAHTFRGGFLDLFQPIVRNQEVIGTVFLRSDLRQLRERIDEYIQDAFVILVIGLALSVLLSIVLQQTISRPVIDLVGAARNVSDTGDYSQRVVPRSKDELGALSAAFNEMLELIQKRDASLLEARDTLEQRVEERTRELQEAKDRLEQSLAAEQDARTAAEEARKIAEEANQTKSIFLANMSHEIRTPMNAILGYAQILQGDADLSDDHRKAIETIGQSGRHLLGLINDILDISKIEAGRQELNPSDFDLRGLAQGLAKMFEVRCRQKDLRWHRETDVPEGFVRGDENKLRQVLINLLGNAVKFTGEGEVVLRVQARASDRYSFEVSDTGPGIAPEQQAAIFEPFHQESEGGAQGGTGLGLAIAHRHVELMGGQLGLASEPGEGTRFFFDLLLPPGQGQPEEEERDWSRVQHLADGVSVHALVVDDVATNRDILSQMLTRIGVEVETAESGLQALEQVRQRRPDIVFMDFRMPRMDGVETRRRLVAEHGAMVIVAVSASVFEHQRQGYVEAGFDGFIDKPLRAEQVYACLARLLNATFTYESLSVEPEEPTVDPGDLVLPEPLYRSLKEAVEGHSVTELRKCLDELEALDGAERQLAVHLRRLSQQYDMEAILTTLSEVRHE